MSILRRLALFFFCLGCFSGLSFALDTAQQAETPKATVAKMARKPQPKATTNAQRFKTVSTKPKPGTLRHVRHGMFTLKKKRTPKLVHHKKRSTFHAQYRASKFTHKRKTYADLQPWESRRFKNNQRVKMVEEKPVENLNLQSESWEDQGDALSMADINRFQYRESHSTEAGVPVQAAGTE